MTLSEFTLAQIKAVEDTAQGLFKLLTINFFYDVTRKEPYRTTLCSKGYPQPS